VAGLLRPARAPRWCIWCVKATDFLSFAALTCAQNREAWCQDKAFRLDYILAPGVLDFRLLLLTFSDCLNDPDTYSLITPEWCTRMNMFCQGDSLTKDFKSILSSYSKQDWMERVYRTQGPWSEAWSALLAGAASFMISFSSFDFWCWMQRSWHCIQAMALLTVAIGDYVGHVGRSNLLGVFECIR